MGRELKRKQAKRDGKNVKEIQKKNNDKPLSTKSFITLIIVILVCFAILYILTGVFVTKEIKWFNKSNKTTEEVAEITNKILASDSLKQSEDKYYVYFYNVKEEDSEVKSSVSRIREKVYRVNLKDDFNSNYVGTPSGVVEDINNLKVESPTVIKVENGKISAFYNGKEEIKIALN